MECRSRDGAPPFQMSISGLVAGGAAAGAAENVTDVHELVVVAEVPSITDRNCSVVEPEFTRADGS